MIDRNQSVNQSMSQPASQPIFVWYHRFVVWCVPHAILLLIDRLLAHALLLYVRDSYDRNGYSFASVFRAVMHNLNVRLALSALRVTTIVFYVLQQIFSYQFRTLIVEQLNSFLTQSTVISNKLSKADSRTQKRTYTNILNFTAIQNPQYIYNIKLNKHNA